MKDLGETHNNLGDLVAAEVRQAILSGAIAPGERLKQEALADDLNVSRIPVREALRILEAEGLIESTPGRGSRVVTITKDDATDVLVVRGTLEGLAARLAAARVTTDDIRSLRNVIVEGANITDGETPPQPTTITLPPFDFSTDGSSLLNTGEFSITDSVPPDQFVALEGSFVPEPGSMLLLGPGLLLVLALDRRRARARR